MIPSVTRIILLAVSALGALWGVPIPTVAIVLGSCIAHDGAETGVVWIVGGLIVFELVAGINLGVYSLSYALVVALTFALGKVFSLVPWPRNEQWAFSSLVRTVGIASVVAFLMVVLGTVVQFAYGRGDIASRLGAALGWPIPLVIVIGCLVTVVILHRTIVPFRRQLIFGT